MHREDWIRTYPIRNKDLLTPPDGNSSPRCDLPLRQAATSAHASASETENTINESSHTSTHTNPQTLSLSLTLNTSHTHSNIHTQSSTHTNTLTQPSSHINTYTNTHTNINSNTNTNTTTTTNINTNTSTTNTMTRDPGSCNKIIRFIQANVGRGYLATKDLIETAKQQKSSVLIIQEPYVGTRRRLDLRSLRVVQDTRGSSPPKTAILILDPDIVAEVVSKNVGKNIIGINLKIGNFSMSLIGAYLEGDADIETDLRRLGNVKAGLGGRDVLVAGDLNAKSPWWGSDLEDDRGAAVAEFFGAEDMLVLNKGRTPTFLARRQGREYTNIIDVTAATPRLAARIRNWRVDPDLTDLADHRPVSFEVVLDRQPANIPRPTTRRFNTRKADWPGFCEALDMELARRHVDVGRAERANAPNDIDSLVEDLTSSMVAASETAIPLIKPKRTLRPGTWWTDELAQLKNDANKKRSRIRSARPDRRQAVVGEYLEAKRRYRDSLQKAITDSWRAFCGSQDRENVWQGVHRIIKNCSVAMDDQPLTDPATGATLSPRESADLLARTFYPPDIMGDDSPEHSQTRTLTEQYLCEPLSDEDIVPPFNEEELRSVLNWMNPKKAPGEDGLTSDICTRANIACPGILLGVMNSCLRQGYFPRTWKRAVVKVIPKPGKEDYSAPKSYRPIGLLPVLGKTLEKLLNNRLLWSLGSRGELSPRQYGFIPQRGTEDALYDAVEMVRGTIRAKKIALVVSLDIEGAFDGAWWPGILRCLIERGAERALVRVMGSYLDDRRVLLRYAGEEVSLPTTKGCIQGSTCGPLLWNVQLDPLLRDAERLRAHVQAFADDILIIAEGNTEQEVEAHAGEALSAVADWGGRARMKFAAHKTQAMVVTRKLRPINPKVFLEGVPVTIQGSVKVLGLIIDSRLNFAQHLDAAYTRAVNLCRRVAGAASAGWGLNSGVLRIIYGAVVEPVMLYGASTWAEVANRVVIKKKLDRVTRMFSIMVAKAHRTTSLVAAAALSGIIPLDLRALEQKRLYETKRGRPLPELPGRPLERRISPFALPHPAERRRLKFEHITTPEDMERLSPRRPRLFTDGSKIEGRVGGAVSVWGPLDEIHRAKIALPSYCSVFQAELLAILEALRLSAAKPALRVANILSDSRSALESICDPSSLHPISNLIRDLLSEIEAEGGDIRLYWIRAHVGFAGNERADELAKEAALKSKTAPKYQNFPLSMAKRVIRGATIDAWQERFAVAASESTIGLFTDSVTVAHKAFRDIGMINARAQYLTGHGGFRAYLHRFHLADSPTCICDDVTPETVEHVLLECPRFAHLRFDYEQYTETKLSRETIRDHFACSEKRKRLLIYCDTISKIVTRVNGSKL